MNKVLFHFTLETKEKRWERMMMMKIKRSFIVALGCMGLLSACSKGAPGVESPEEIETPAVVEEKQEVEKENESAVLKGAAVVKSAVADSKPVEPSVSVYEPELQEEELPWKQAYLDFIENFVSNGYPENDAKFYLADVNGDAIPELYCNWSVTAAGGDVLTYLPDTGLDSVHIAAYGFGYIPESGLFRNAGGRMDCYYDIIYEIREDGIYPVAEGSYGAEDPANTQVDENGVLIYVYQWESNPLNKEEYQEEMNQVFDTTIEIHPSYDECMSIQEIRAFLTSEDTAE